MGTAHSKIGASSMYRWQACPGSVQLCAKMPPQASSAYAEEGTEAHDLAARILEKKISTAELFRFDPDMREAVEIYTDYVDDLWSKVPRHNDSVRLIEHRFDLESVYPGCFGTCDAVIYDAENKRLHVIDYKHGAGVFVDVENNPQLKYYALGALLSMKGAPINEVVLTIAQPRIQGAEPVRSTTILADDLADFAGDLYHFADATTKPNAPLETGDHCGFCAAKPICPKLRETANIAVKAAFAEAELPSLPPEVVSDLLTKVAVIEEWCKSVRSFAYNEAKEGRTPPGFKLVPKRATRKWAEPEKAAAFLEANIHQSVFRTLMTEPELKSPAQVEKILGTANASIIGPLVVSISSGDTLVPDSDKREAIGSNRGQNLFPAFTD